MVLGKLTIFFKKRVTYRLQGLEDLGILLSPGTANKGIKAE